MPKKNEKSKEKGVEDYRHEDATRKNNPPAGIASHGVISEKPQQEYAYNPHLPPNLRFDGNGDADELPELLEKAQQGALSADEVKIIAEALRHQAPWLEWAGKKEAKSFAVDPVALHIHERVSTQAVVKVAARENVQRELFADPQQEYREAVQFYEHDVDWTNRLILGDSLSVMSSLAKREDLAGKVQMIYIDPPYGIRFASNFQPTVFQHDVKEKAEDLTREPEQIKAYRDTWRLGIHTYLAYLRDRLIVAKDLLTDSGSIFVQIGDENLHRVRCLMDEVFGSENSFATIVFKKKNFTMPGHAINDYILHYAKNRTDAKLHTLYGTITDQIQHPDDKTFNRVLTIHGDLVNPTSEAEEIELLEPGGKWCKVADRVISQQPSDTRSGEIILRNRKILPGSNAHWAFDPGNILRLEKAQRLHLSDSGRLSAFVFWADVPRRRINNFWNDTTGEPHPSYAVQTSTKVIERCLLMTTDPGDLVLDPTCGSGTTAYVAERWGRRWIMIDTSRVATSLTLQRILTATYDYYKLKDKSEGVTGGFVNKTVPHIMLKSIAQNTSLDPIFAKHEPILKERLKILNGALAEVTPKIRAELLAKLAAKEKREKKKAITDADRRRWKLPKTEWQEWEVPFDTDPDWPEVLQEALTDYREAWRAKMDAVNACIAASSQGEELVDQPMVDRKKLRVSGPFTVEAVQPAEESLDMDSPVGGEPEEVSDTFEADDAEGEPINAEAYLDQMVRLLRNDGVRFPDNQTLKFTTLESLEGEILHAEGSWEDNGTERSVAVVFGPKHGSVTEMQVQDCLGAAYRRRYDVLVFAGFSFDGAAQAAIQADLNPRVRTHMAHINPDVTMGDLLKDTHTSQLFTVFGLPRTELEMTDNEEYIVKMEGVDIYDPVENKNYSANADRVAAWFLDTDYDGRTFCITQAFFPDKTAWRKIARALKSVIDEERFEKFSGTESLPFPAGKHTRAAVKVIDPRGNEVMRVHDLKSINR